VRTAFSNNTVPTIRKQSKLLSIATTLKGLSWEWTSHHKSSSKKPTLISVLLPLLTINSNFFRVLLQVSIKLLSKSMTLLPKYCISKKQERNRLWKNQWYSWPNSFKNWIPTSKRKWTRGRKRIKRLRFRPKEQQPNFEVWTSVVSLWVELTPNWRKLVNKSSNGVSSSKKSYRISKKLQWRVETQSVCHHSEVWCLRWTLARSKPWRKAGFNKRRLWRTSNPKMFRLMIIHRFSTPKHRIQKALKNKSPKTQRKNKDLSTSKSMGK